MQYTLKHMVAGASIVATFALMSLLFVIPAHAYELTNKAQAATTSTATSSDDQAAAILGDVTEQEFATLLENATAVTEKTLAKEVVSGSIIAIGPNTKGQQVMLIEMANGSTSVFSLATKALIVRDDGSAAALADLAPGQHIVIAPQDALLSPATVTGGADGTLVVSKTDGTDVTIGTSSKALIERDTEPAVALDFASGESVVLVESEDAHGSSTVLALIKPHVPEVQAAPEVATTTATSTPEPTQNNMFLWIVIGVAVLVLIVGYFLMRRGSSY